MYKIENSIKFITYITDATSKLHNYDTEESYKLILKAIIENPDAPEPHNLLGIWYEFKGNNDLARKHYRAAYALDPTYRPASENLERVCTFFNEYKRQVNFGEERNETPSTKKTI